MNERKTTVLFSIAMFLSYFAQAISYCLLIPYLSNIGYSATQRSYMFSIGAVLGMVFQFLLGYLCDKEKTVKKYAHIVDIVYCLLVFAVYYFDKPNYPFHMIVVSLMFVFFRLSMGVYDSWVLESGETIKNRYGLIRAFGSLGWSVASILGGMIIEKFGYIGLFYGFVAVTVPLIVINILTNDAQKATREKIHLKDVSQLLNNKGYLVVVCALFAVYFMQSSVDVSIVDKLDILNATEKQISVYWMITSAVELPLFFIGNKLEKKFGSANLFLFACVIYGIRFILFGLASSVDEIIYFSTLQCASFPIIQVVSKYMIDKETPENLKSTGLQLGLVLYSLTSAFFAPLLIGFVEDNAGINQALYIIAGFSIIGLVFGLIYKKRQKKIS